MSMEIKKCKGEGQGICTGCENKGKWNRVWTSMLYKVEGMEGTYCSDCLEEIKRMSKQTKQVYEQKALQYAEHYGIITYKVTGNTMIYNQNYRNSECINGKWRDNPCTYQRRINLDTMETTTIKLKRLNKNGWDNV